MFETQGSSAIWLGGADDRGQRQRRYAPFEFVLRRSGKSSLAADHLADMIINLFQLSTALRPGSGMHYQERSSFLL